MKIYIKTFGCRVNQVESEALLEEFLRRGHQIINSPQYADICIINTCSVTRNADRDALKEANLIKRKSPNARLILTGCFARHGTCTECVRGHEKNFLTLIKVTISEFRNRCGLTHTIDTHH